MKKAILFSALILFILGFARVPANAAEILNNRMQTEAGGEFIIGMPESGEIPDDIVVYSYHLGGGKDFYRLPIDPVIRFQPGSGDYLWMFSSNEDGVLSQEGAERVGPSTKEQFKLDLSLSAPVVKPQDQVTISLRARGGVPPYSQISLSVTSLNGEGDTSQELAVFEGEGDFQLHLAGLPFGDAKTLCFYAQARDSRGQGLREEKYLQISDEGMAPLEIKTAFEGGSPVLTLPAALHVEIVGGVPPYSYQSAWIVSSALDGLAMPGEWEDGPQSSILYNSEAGFGIVTINARDSAGHLTRVSVPYQVAINAYQTRRIREVLHARELIQKGLPDDGATGISAEYQKLLGRWVSQDPEDGARIVFYRDGTAYIDVVQSKYERMNFTYQNAGILEVGNGQMRLISSGDDGDDSSLHYQLNGDQLDFYRNDEGVRLVRDTSFIP